MMADITSLARDWPEWDILVARGDNGSVSWHARTRDPGYPAYLHTPDAEELEQQLLAQDGGSHGQ